MTWLSSLAVLNGLKNGSLPWRPDLKKAAESLQRKLEKADTHELAVAVDAEARSRLTAFTEGVARYNHFPRDPRPAEPPEFWRDGTTRVLDYGTSGENKQKDGPPILLVPSLINRGYILDLTHKRSLARHLANEGFRPFLVDWGAPGREEKHFDLSDYIFGRLEPAAEDIFLKTGQAPVLVGYCMGGLLTLALAARRPEKARALVLLATPWDFHANATANVRLLKTMAPVLTGLIDLWGELPVDVIQTLFASLDPYMTSEKFRRFSGLNNDSAKAHHFVALEDWLNDGVPLVAPVARECLLNWYGENAPATGAWRTGGRLVKPSDIRMPTFVVIPDQDHIVPPESAAALADAIPGADSMTLKAGHIGMVAGSQAPALLYKPLTNWLRKTLTKIKEEEEKIA
ncbi:MAG: alpha/beta fold hydrolase [Rhodospirillales bacterium]|nr:alpha/beta fold hydrolase [Rhodospirillales bacterium]